jgi:uncharacterized protein (DUF433 family)
MIPSELRPYLFENPNVMGGEVCFQDTRIPVSIFWDNFFAGMPVRRILEEYPDIQASHAQAILAWGHQYLSHPEKTPFVRA